MVHLDQDVFCFGDEPCTQNDAVKLKVTSPVEKGIVTNWGDTENTWHHAFDQLRFAPEERHFLITEPPLNPRANRKNMTEVLFEVFNVPAFHAAHRTVSALYASGRTTGLVFQAGLEFNYTVPIFEATPLPQAIRRKEGPTATLRTSSSSSCQIAANL